VRLNVAHRQPAAIEREDLVVEPDDAALALTDDLRLKAPVPIARRVDLDLPALGESAFFGVVPFRWFPAPPAGSQCGS